MPKPKNKLTQTYILQKRVQAANVADAIKLDKTTAITEVFTAKEEAQHKTIDAIGFEVEDEQCNCSDCT